MSTITLKTGEVIPQAIYESTMTKLTELDRTKPVEFCKLVRACRSPNFEIKRCVFTPQKCRNENHVDCVDTSHYLELIESFDDQAHAVFDPIVRAIILAAAQGLMLPRLVSPLA